MAKNKKSKIIIDAFRTDYIDQKQEKSLNKDLDSLVYIAWSGNIIANLCKNLNKKYIRTNHTLLVYLENELKIWFSITRNKQRFLSFYDSLLEEISTHLENDPVKELNL